VGDESKKFFRYMRQREERVAWQEWNAKEAPEKQQQEEEETLVLTHWPFDINWV
jgi:hypothetical protein